VQKFKDNAGRDWIIAINVPSVDRVLAATDVDLFSIIEDSGTLFKKLGNVRTLVRVLYVLCEPQVQKLNLQPEDFAAAIAGDALDSATKALLEDLTGFFQQDQRRTLKAVLVKAEEASQVRSEDLIGKIKALDIRTILAEAAETARPQASAERSIASPASPASIPES
jgi:hypothetical protein